MGGEELELVNEAFASNYIAPIGPMVNRLEAEFAEYLGIPHTLALSSGTAAMHLALRELGVGPDDVVFASTLTFIGSVSPVTFLGADLVFIDCDASWNIDPELVAAELKRRADTGEPLPKAIVPTDLYGQCANLPRLQEICAPYDIPVVADSAEALGATCVGKPAGQGARASIYSFNGNKIITSSGGGLLASDDKEFIDHARFLSTQARDPAPHYEHTTIGYNYRMSNIVAAIGIGQLHVLDERVRRRREIFDTYAEGLGDLPGFTFMPEADHGQCNRWLTTLTIDPDLAGTDRETIRLALEAENIESRPVWKPMHLQPVFENAPAVGGTVSERLFDLGLCLPSGTALTSADIDRITSLIRAQVPEV